MLIQLRQSEIEEALKMYVTRQGFSLAGKTVEIAFTASRGNNGITADLDITDAGGIHLAAIQQVKVVEEVLAVTEQPQETPASPFVEITEEDQDEGNEPAPASSLFS